MTVKGRWKRRGGESESKARKGDTMEEAQWQGEEGNSKAEKEKLNC